jgi:polyisoprenoid-binding protein YceI
MLRNIFFSLIILAMLSACAAPAPVPSPTEVPVPTPTEAIEMDEGPPIMAETPSQLLDSDIDQEKEIIIYKIVPGESKVRYEVGETFINQSNRFNLAVGTTTQVEGEVIGNKSEPEKSSVGPITVNISQFTSDSSRRDSAIRGRWLESEKFPIATFSPTNIEGLPASYTEGQEYAFRITGDLTVREVTKPVTFEVNAVLNGDTLSGFAETTILMSEFGVGPISIAGVLNTEDQAKLILEFVARP